MLWTWEQSQIHAPAAAQAWAAQRRAAQRRAIADAKVAEGFRWLWAHESRALLRDLDTRDRRARPARRQFTLADVRSAFARAARVAGGVSVEPLNRREAGRQRGVLIRANLWDGGWSVNEDGR
jgi:hypothetical protein